MARRALITGITGITGQDGSYLADLLLGEGLQGAWDGAAILDGRGSRVRAQAVSRDGTLVDDWGGPEGPPSHIVSATERALHVRNAPSPAATSALALARLIADRAEPGLD